MQLRYRPILILILYLITWVANVWDDVYTREKWHVWLDYVLMEQIPNHKTLGSADLVETASNECLVEAINNGSSTNSSIRSMCLNAWSTMARHWGGHSTLLTIPLRAALNGHQVWLLSSLSALVDMAAMMISGRSALPSRSEESVAGSLFKADKAFIFAAANHMLTVDSHASECHETSWHLQRVSNLICHEWTDNGKLLHLVCQLTLHVVPLWPFI